MPRIAATIATLALLLGSLSGAAPAAGDEGWRLCQAGGMARSSCSVSCNGESRRQSCGNGEICECRCAPRPQCRCRAMDGQATEEHTDGGKAVRPGVPAGLAAGGHRTGRQG